MTTSNLIHKFDISSCNICKNNIPFSPNPVLQVSQNSRILVIGQAPGLKAHQTNMPWNDPSGDRLRDWFGVDKDTFYNPDIFALMPMGFCYPGKGKSGDLPPRKECAATWHQRLLKEMDVKVTFLIGSYAQNHYLKDKISLTQRVESWQDYLPEYVVLPHPSPRNNIWLKRHAWFEQSNIPRIRKLIDSLL